MKIFLTAFIMLSAVLSVPNVASAEIEEREFIGEFGMGYNDTFAQAKKYALEDALRKASEYVGINIETSSEAINFKLTSDQIKITSEAYVRIIEEPPEFIGTLCKVRIIAIIDWDAINNSLKDGQAQELDSTNDDAQAQESNVNKIPGYEEYNGHYYKIFNISVNWLKASQYCKENGGYLVTITSKEEQATVEKLMMLQGKKNYYWTGGFRIGVDDWQWGITREAFMYTNWDQNEPNNDLGNEYTMVMYGTGKWGDCPMEGINDIPSLDFFNVKNAGFICEWDSYDDIKDTEND